MKMWRKEGRLLHEGNNILLLKVITMYVVLKYYLKVLIHSIYLEV